MLYQFDLNIPHTPKSPVWYGAALPRRTRHEHGRPAPYPSPQRRCVGGRMARLCGMFTSKRYYTNLTSTFRILLSVLRLLIRQRAFPWKEIPRGVEALHATPLRRNPGNMGGAAGPRTPAATQSRWRTNGKNMRNMQVETVLARDW